MPIHKANRMHIASYQWTCTPQLLHVTSPTNSNLQHAIKSNPLQLSTTSHAVASPRSAHLPCFLSPCTSPHCCSLRFPSSSCSSFPMKLPFGHLTSFSRFSAPLPWLRLTNPPTPAAPSQHVFFMMNTTWSTTPDRQLSYSYCRHVFSKH